jgi:hypothetical protein
MKQADCDVVSGGMGQACDVWERREMHMGLWWENLKESDHYLEDLGIDVKMIMKWLINK